MTPFAPSIAVEQLSSRRVNATVQRTSGEELFYAVSGDGRVHGLRLSECLVPAEAGRVRGYFGESMKELALHKGVKVQLVLGEDGDAQAAILPDAPQAGTHRFLWR